MTKDRIIRKIDQLETYLGKFQDILPKTEYEYLNSFEKQLVVERLLQICLKTMIDLVLLVAKVK